MSFISKPLFAWTNEEFLQFCFFHQKTELSVCQISAQFRFYFAAKNWVIGSHFYFPTYLVRSWTDSLCYILTVYRIYQSVRRLKSRLFGEWSEVRRWVPVVKYQGWSVTLERQLGGWIDTLAWIDIPLICAFCSANSFVASFDAVFRIWNLRPRPWKRERERQVHKSVWNHLSRHESRPRNL